MTDTTDTLDYKDSLFLPKTDFPQKGNLPVREPERLAAWNAMGLYRMIREARAGRPRYVLHDGPPYANGDIHLGHVINKILKDLVVKMRTMEGLDSPYVPGWDCHGLPIERHVDDDLGNKWERAIAKLGIDLRMLSGDAGHA